MTYPTKAECKTYAGIVGATHDTTIDQILAHIIKAVETHTNRLFVAASVTKTFKVRHPFVTRKGMRLNLFRDLVSITTLTNGNGDVIASGDYDLFPEVPYYRIDLRRGKGNWFQSDGEDTSISIAGSWGYSTACPADIFLEIMRLVRLTFEARSDGEGVFVTRQGTIIDRAQWPKSTLEILDGKARTR